jgi:hypothetical protein
MPRENFGQMADAMRAINTHVHTYAVENHLPRDWFMEQSTRLHPVSLSAARKLQILAPYVEAFFSDLNEVIRNHGLPDGTQKSYYYNIGRDFTMQYPVIWNANKDGVICFPNLTMDLLSPHTGLRNENPWFPKCSVTLHERIRDDLSDPKRSQAWLPVSRGIKRLGTRTDTSVSRALSRAILWKGDKLACPQFIDNTAARLIEMHRPADFQFATTAEEMRVMYTRETSSETPSSCMDSKHNFALYRPDRPVDFYGYCPITMGAYLSRSGVVTARAICWLNPKDGEWYYSRVYASRSASREELRKNLKKHNIRDIDTLTKPVCFTAEFDIPAGKYNDSAACPMPYFDSQPFDCMALKLSHDRTMFHIRIGERNIIAPKGEGWQYPNLSGTAGSYCAHESTECSNCGDEIDTENDSFWNVEGDVYCSVTCAEDCDAVWYLTSGDTDLLYHRTLDTTHTVRAYHGNGVFSNEHAARVRGYVYHPVPWADVESHMFVYYDEYRGDDMDISYAGQSGYVWDAKNTSVVRMYCDERDSPRHAANITDGYFTFHSFPVVSETTNPKKVDDTTTVMRYIATCDNPDNFDDSMFDDYLGDLLRPHAPLFSGVTILQQPTDNDLF